jgi:hypothetical protein
MYARARASISPSTHRATLSVHARARILRTCMRVRKSVVWVHARARVSVSASTYNVCRASSSVYTNARMLRACVHACVPQFVVLYAHARASLCLQVRACSAALAVHACACMFCLCKHVRDSVSMVYARVRASVSEGMRMQREISVHAHACMHMCMGVCATVCCWCMQTSMHAHAHAARVHACEQRCVDGVCTYARKVACKYAHAKRRSLCSRMCANVARLHVRE